MARYIPINFPITKIAMSDTSLTEKDFRHKNREFYYPQFVVNKRSISEVIQDVQEYFEIEEMSKKEIDLNADLLVSEVRIKMDHIDDYRVFHIINNEKSRDLYRMVLAIGGYEVYFSYNILLDSYSSNNVLLQSMLIYWKGVDLGNQREEELYAENIYNLNVWYTVLKSKEMQSMVAKGDVFKMETGTGEILELTQKQLREITNEGNLDIVNYHPKLKGSWRYRIGLPEDHDIYIYDNFLFYDDIPIYCEKNDVNIE